jgi:predicted nucleic-acid-binding protein
MIAVDTNVLLRFVLKDDMAQFEAAARFLGRRTPEDPAFVSLIVLCETAWVLQNRYRYSVEQVFGLVSMLLETAEIRIEDEAEISALIADREGQGDLADHLISYSARRGGCVNTVTFDRRAAIAVSGMELLA